MKEKKSTKTLRVRVKDKHSSTLREWARSVNFVWNYVNDLSCRSIRERGRFLSAYDVHPYTKGSSAHLDLHSQTVQGVTEEYVGRRNQFRKTRLRWRKSTGRRRSLGWVPFKGGSATFKSGQIVFSGRRFDLWDSYGLDGYRLRAGSFNEDSRGRWYFNVAVDAAPVDHGGQEALGIDLGIKALATCSDGSTLESGRFYRDLEGKLAISQRANRRPRTRAIHAKIANRRKDALHKFSNALVKRSGLIVVGNVSSANLTQTKMAKSVLDAGWGMLKTMLEYKCDHAGVIFKVVDERNTTQTCSSCMKMPGSRPIGIAGLGIREWTCCECGVTHDRDVNAARNILALGHERPVVGMTSDAAVRV